MAVSFVEEKILGRLGRQSEASNPLLSSSLFQVLGLSILLSRKLVKARKVRRLDTARDTKSVHLYHHIIWLAREALSITEVYILPYCQDGEHGPECRVMAAKLRASLYHLFCLFHNNPPVSAVAARSPASSDSTKSSTPERNRPAGSSPGHSSKYEKEKSSRRKAEKAPLRDPIPSMISDASYVTNPYAGLASSSTPPPIPTSERRTPSRPPGLKQIKISSPQAAAAFLLPPLNFVPMAAQHFATAQHLAESLLAPAHGLRLSVSLEHSAFLWDCEKDHFRAQRLARKTIRDVYTSSEGLDDEEFADASLMVRALGGIVKRGASEAVPPPTREQVSNDTKPVRSRTSPSPSHAQTRQSLEHSGAERASPDQHMAPARSRPHIDRTIAVSPKDRRRSRKSSSSIPQSISLSRTPDRLSTVPEVESTDVSEAPSRSATSPPASRKSNSRTSTVRRRSTSSTASDKASKRRAVEAAEEIYRRTSLNQKRSNSSNGGGRSGVGNEHQASNGAPRGGGTQGSHLPTHPNRTQRHPSSPTQEPPRPYPGPAPPPPPSSSPPKARDPPLRAEAHDRRQAILRTLDVLSAVSRGLQGGEGNSGGGGGSANSRDDDAQHVGHAGALRVV
nr:hypothetical protein CFP56_71593 [Quercus suber]